MENQPQFNAKLSISFPKILFPKNLVAISAMWLDHEKRARCLLVLSSVPVLFLLGDIDDSQLCLSLSLSAKEDGLGHMDLS